MLSGKGFSVDKRRKQQVEESDPGVEPAFANLEDPM